MTIQSYLVYPEPGQSQAVREALQATGGCEVIPAVNRDVMVLVTEAADERSQQELERALEEIEGVACLAMVGGWTE